jgi:hypothetical protein
MIMNTKWFNVFPQVPDEFHERVTTTISTLEIASNKNFIKKERFNIMEQRVNNGAKRIYATVGGVLAAIMLVVIGGGLLVYNGFLGNGRLSEQFLPGTAGVDDDNIFADLETDEPDISDIITVEPPLTIGMAVNIVETIKKDEMQRDLYAGYLNHVMMLFDEENAGSNEYGRIAESLKPFSTGFTASVTDNGTTVNIVDILSCNREAVIFLEIIAPEGVIFRDDAFRYNIASDIDFGDEREYAANRFNRPLGINLPEYEPGVFEFIGYGMGGGGLEFLSVGETPNIAYFMIRFSVSRIELYDIESLDIYLDDLYMMLVSYSEEEMTPIVEGTWSFMGIKPGFKILRVLTAEEFLTEPAPLDRYILTGAKISPLGFTLSYDAIEGIPEPFHGFFGMVSDAFVEYKDGTTQKIYTSISTHQPGINGEVHFISIIPIEVQNVALIHIDDVVLSAWKLFGIE